MIMSGEKTSLMTGSRPNKPRLLLPQEELDAFRKSPPDQTIDRFQGGPWGEWISAIKGDGPAPGSNFDYASKLTEMILIGVLAQRFNKRIGFEGGINTPMIAHWPNGITQEMRGQLYREPCHLIDLLPTWMELAGQSARYPGAAKEQDIAPLDGISISPSFSGKSLHRSQPLFFQFLGGKAVHDGDWKLVRSGSRPWELYHFKNGGRTESHDLAAAYPERVNAMEQAWFDWYRSCTGKDYTMK